MIASTVRRTPSSRPGKNPARMAIAGNLSQDASAVALLRDGACDALLLGLLEIWLDALDDEAEEGADVVEAGMVDDADGLDVDEPVDEEELLAFMMHC